MCLELFSVGSRESYVVWHVRITYLSCDHLLSKCYCFHLHNRALCRSSKKLELGLTVYCTIRSVRSELRLIYYLCGIVGI